MEGSTVGPAPSDGSVKLDRAAGVPVGGAAGDAPGARARGRAAPATPGRSRCVGEAGGSGTDETDMAVTVAEMAEEQASNPPTASESLRDCSSGPVRSPRRRQPDEGRARGDGRRR